MISLWNIPDVYQRAIRLSFSVFLACIIGFGVILPNEGIHVKHKKEFSNAFKWAAITCIVVNAPVIGRVAQTGVERMAGTVLGGWCGFGVYMIGRMFWDELSDGIVLSVAAATVAFASVIMAWAFSLDNTAKLFALTFMLVTFGSAATDTGIGALVLTLTRIGGICTGVILSELTSVLIFPRSATQEALLHLRNTLKKLTELNAMAWQHGPLFRPDWQSANGKDSRWSEAGYVPLPLHVHKEDWSLSAEDRERRFEEECERVLMDVYNSLYKVQDFLPQAKSEIYMGNVRQQLCFLPGIPWMQLGRRILPEKDVQELATCIRRVARLLWAVHLTFQQGFDENMLEMLKQQYPARLLPELAHTTQGVLQDMLDAFPNSQAVPSGNLHALVSAVESLLRISDYSRRRILHHMKHYRDLKRTRSRRSGSRASSRTASPSHPAAAASASDSRSPAASASIPIAGGHNLRPGEAAQLLSPATQLASSTQMGSRRFSLPRDYALGRSKTRKLPDQVGALAAGGQEGNAPATLGDMVGQPARQRGRENGVDEDDLRKPLLDTELAVTDEPAAHSAPAYRPPAQAARSSLAPSPFASASGNSIAAGSPEEAPPPLPRETSTANAMYHGSPNEVFRNLPDGLSIDVGSPCQDQPQHSYAVEVASDDEGARRVSIRLQRIESGELIVFPETAEGYVSKVRFYSFQFLMEELTEELEEMHIVLGDLIAQLPRPALRL